MATTATANPQQKVIWAAQPGPQAAMLACPVEDILFGGARGGGKTDALIGDFAAHQMRHGKNAKGILFRRSYPEMEQVEARALEMYGPIGAVYQAGRRTFVFPEGGTLKLRHVERDQDATRYQGHSYTWVGIDELTQWGSPDVIDVLRATLRSSTGVPCVMRSTANPGGRGHNWVKRRYIDPAEPWQPFYDSKSQCWRVYIPSTLDDNPALALNDPNYWHRVMAATAGDEALQKAWRFGIWDIVAGGFFDDLWDPSIHILDTFKIPPSWRIDRSFDWGSSKPFSVGWWAESDGTPAIINGQTRVLGRGSAVRIAEWYGYTGEPDRGLQMTPREVAKGILQREKLWNLHNVWAGPADPAIFTRDGGFCIADEMKKAGVRWKAAKSRAKDSRKNGWMHFRQMLLNAKVNPLELPGLYVVKHCREFIRTVPVLPRDERDMEDVDTAAEDHIADEARYRLYQERRRLIEGTLTGV